SLFNLTTHLGRLVFLNRVRQIRSKVQREFDVKPLRKLLASPVRNAHQVVTILVCKLARRVIRHALVECQIGDVAPPLELLQHVVSANLSALIDRMKQFGFEPKDSHAHAWAGASSASRAVGSSTFWLSSPSKNRRCHISKFSNAHNRSSWFS